MWNLVIYDWLNNRIVKRRFYCEEDAVNKKKELESDIRNAHLNFYVEKEESK